MATNNRSAAAIGRLTCMLADSAELRKHIRNARTALLHPDTKGLEVIQASDTLKEIQVCLAELCETACDTENDLAVLISDPAGE